MSKELKDFFAGIELTEFEEFNELTMQELSDNKGEDDDELHEQPAC